jgi:hypothetical protein
LKGRPRDRDRPFNREDRPRERDRDRPFRDERPVEPIAAAPEPQPAPVFEAPPQPAESGQMLRSEDGGESHAPAFLQVRARRRVHRPPALKAKTSPSPAAVARPARQAATPSRRAPKKPRDV